MWGFHFNIQLNGSVLFFFGLLFEADANNYSYKDDDKQHSNYNYNYTRYQATVDVSFASSEKVNQR